MSQEYEMPDLTTEEVPEFVPSTRIPDEVKAMAAEARTASEKPAEVHAKHFKIGNLDVDTLPTETTGFSPGMMTAEEMTSVESRLQSQWKELSPHDQKKAIREYLELRRSGEQRPN